ncbi:DUF2892 domain-containing protein [Salipaludibacillus sp. HK11]|uniref:YgaP family membrane protein n=1 Tax=Salipaludibacillus sp. HK11 TaxID=3394320 RepID=UPI0039FCED69
MKPNIGTLNALIRITCGFTLLGWGTAKLVKRSHNSSPILAMIMGSMKVAEGITRFCPIVFMYEERQSNNDDFTEEAFPPVNPS